MLLFDNDKLSLQNNYNRIPRQKSKHLFFFQMQCLLDFTLFPFTYQLHFPPLYLTHLQFASVRGSKPPPPAGSGQLWCQNAWRRRRRREKQGELVAQLSPSVSLSICPRQCDPGPRQREQAHPIQVRCCVRVWGGRRREERCAETLFIEKKVNNLECGEQRRLK